MRKFLSIFFIMLTLIISFVVLSIGTTSFASESWNESHWAYDDIQSLLLKNKMDINEEFENNFEPNRCATIGEIVFLMNRFFVEYPIETPLDEESYLSREEVAVMVCKAFSFTSDGMKETIFLDNEKITTEAKEFVSCLHEKEIVIGYPDNTFRPQQNITLAEIMVILSRCDCIKFPELEIIDNNPSGENLEEGFPSIEMGIFCYRDGQVVVEDVLDKLVLEVDETIEFAVMIPEGAQEDDILCEVEDETIVALEDDFYTLTGLRQGSTKIFFYTDKQQFKKEIEIVVIENTNEEDNQKKSI